VDCSATIWFFLPRSAVIVLIFVAMDGCNWLAHLMNHRVRMFWRFHELHHSQRGHERSYGLSNSSTHSRLLPHDVVPGSSSSPMAPFRLLWVAYAGFVAFEHSNTNLGSVPGADIRQPELPPVFITV